MGTRSGSRSQTTKHAIFTIRYSLLHRDGKSAWKLGKESEQKEYEKDFSMRTDLRRGEKRSPKLLFPQLPQQ